MRRLGAYSRRSLLDTTTISQLRDLADGGAWTALAALAVALIARAAKENRLGAVFSRVPVHHRPRVVAALGILAGILEAVVRGVPWVRAIVGGVVTGGLAMWVHGVAGGVSPKPELLAPGQIRVTAPPGASVAVEAVLGESGERPIAVPSSFRAQPTGPEERIIASGSATLGGSVDVEPSQAWGPAPRGGDS